VLRAVLFDLYDTLVYVDEDGLSAKMLHCAQAAAVAPEDFRRGWFATSHDSIHGRFASIEERAAAVLRALGREPRNDAVATIAAAERSFLRMHVHPFADAHATLDALRTDGLQLAIVTNASASVALVLDSCQLREHVDDVVISSNANAVKPNPEIYTHALARVAVAAGDACYVGDGNDAELDGAKAVGLRTILVRRDRPRYGVRASSSDASVDDTVAALAEIPVLLRGFDAAATARR
jgi:putative hydrolase of the HAD superfamily